MPIDGSSPSDIFASPTIFIMNHGETRYILERSRKGSRKLNASSMSVDPSGHQPLDYLIAFKTVPLTIRRVARTHFGIN